MNTIQVIRGQPEAEMASSGGSTEPWKTGVNPYDGPLKKVMDLIAAKKVADALASARGSKPVVAAGRCIRYALSSDHHGAKQRARIAPARRHNTGFETWRMAVRSVP